MIDTNAFYLMMTGLILLFIFGLYAVYKENVLGFAASGFAVIMSIAFTALAGFGRVGSEIAFLNETTGDIISQVRYIDTAMVFTSVFISALLFIILIFVLGRYTAALAMQHSEEGDE